MNWMNHHAPKQGASVFWRTCAALALCPVAGALLGTLVTGGESGMLGGSVDAAVSATVGAFGGLVAAPVVGWVVWNRASVH
jgi:hypothetical protein